MIRSLRFSLAAGLLLLTASCGVAESFPAVHNEPITVLILNGQNGQPLARVHLLLIAGYDQREMRDQLWREETLTDAQGQARLSGQLANLPWLQVWVDKMPLCQAKPRAASFSVERIRRDGLSAPNCCGLATVEDAPGVFTVFVKGKGKSVVGGAVATIARVQTKTPKAAPAAISAPNPAAQTLAQKVVEAQAAPPAPTLPAAAPILSAAAVAAAAPASAPVEAAPKAAPSAPVAAPVATVVAVQGPAIVQAKANARTPVRRVAGRPAAHRPRLIAHRPQLLSVACPARQPAPRSAPAAAARTTRKLKPAAGVKLAAVPLGKPKAPPRQE